MSIKPLGYALGARIGGVDISKALDGETIARIHAALLANVVVCLSAQPADTGAEELLRFATCFGELDDNRRFPNDRYPGHDEILVLSNKKITVGGKTTGGYGIATMWHSDLAFTSRPSTITFLLAKDVPDVGGDTMFANMYRAYEALSPAMQQTIEPLECVHDIALGPTYRRASPEDQARIRANNTPSIHRVVRTHPETGRKALCLGDRARNFVGMSVEESKPLIDFLNAHATRYELTYRHRWAVGDLLMWDNRCAMHHALMDYDLEKQLRRMLRCSLLGPAIGRPAEELAEVVPA